MSQTHLPPSPPARPHSSRFFAARKRNGALNRSLSSLLSHVTRSIEESNKTWIESVTLNTLWHARGSREYRESLNRLTALNIMEDAWVTGLGALAGIHPPKPLPMRRVVPAVMDLACREGYTVFILGSDAKTLSRAKKYLLEHNILPYSVTSWAQPFSKLDNPEINQAVLERVRDEEPDLLFVAFDGPEQALWIARNWDALPNCVIISAGDAFRGLADFSVEAEWWPGWPVVSGLEDGFDLLGKRGRRERAEGSSIFRKLRFACQLAVEIKLNPIELRGFFSQANRKLV